jgi:hypothetical protein
MIQNSEAAVGHSSQPFRHTFPQGFKGPCGHCCHDNKS